MQGVAAAESVHMEVRLRCAMASRGREWEMARRNSGKRGAAIIALIAAIAALAGPSVASASPGKGKAAPPASVPASSGGASGLASWAEEASWAEG